MKHTLTLASLLLTIGSLSACQSNPMPLNTQTNPALVSAQRAKQVMPPKRSDKVLDAVSKHMLASYFRQMDQDRNGVLTASEIGPMPFQGSDTDKDGRITFNEFMGFDFNSIPYAPTRNALRSMAKTKWDGLNKDKNNFLIFEEVLEDFPDFSSPYPGNGYGDGYSDPGYGGGYGSPQNPRNGYGNSPGYGDPNGSQPLPPPQQTPKYDTAAAKSFFNLTDINLDRRLTFSEYEDGLARKFMN